MGAEVRDALPLLFLINTTKVVSEITGQWYMFAAEISCALIAGA